jgi:hypothetical protein
LEKGDGGGFFGPNILMILCEPLAHVDSREGGNPDAVPVEMGNKNPKKSGCAIIDLSIRPGERTSGMTDQRLDFGLDPE